MTISNEVSIGNLASIGVTLTSLGVIFGVIKSRIAEESRLSQERYTQNKTNFDKLLQEGSPKLQVLSARVDALTRLIDTHSMDAKKLEALHTDVCWMKGIIASMAAKMRVPMISGTGNNES